MGLSISESNTKILLVISKELKSWAQERAKQDNRSMTNYIIHLIEQDRAKINSQKSDD